jgi:RNA recognition motif-containing protein
LRYFYYAFCRFTDTVAGKQSLLILYHYVAKKLSQDIRYPEIRGKVCRALPYDKDSAGMKLDPGSSLFVKDIPHDWTHKDLYTFFKEFGEILSAKVSIEESHESRGYGFVQF